MIGCLLQINMGLRRLLSPITMRVGFSSVWLRSQITMRCLFLLCFGFHLATLIATAQDCPIATVPTGDASRIDDDNVVGPSYSKHLQVFDSGVGGYQSDCDCWYLIELNVTFNLDELDSLLVHGQLIENNTGNTWSGSQTIHVWLNQGESLIFQFDGPPASITSASIASATVRESGRRLVPCSGSGNGNPVLGCQSGGVAAPVVTLVVPLGEEEPDSYAENIEEPSFSGLRLTGAAPSADLLHPICLGFPESSARIEVIRDPNNQNAIRQVKGCGLLVVEIQSAWEYDIYRYPDANIGPKDANGYYTTSGPYTMRYTVRNPDPVTFPGNEKVSIIQHVGAGGTITHTYTWSAVDQGWTLERGNGLCIESTSRVETPMTRTEEYVIKNPVTMATLYKCVSEFTSSPTGWFLSKKTVNPGPDEEVTSYTPSVSTGGSNQLLVDWVDMSDGQRNGYVYDATDRVTLELKTFKDSIPSVGLQGNRIQYNYAPVFGSGDDGTIEPDTPREISKYKGGVIIAKTFRIFKPNERWEIVATAPNNTWNAPDNLVTIRRYFGTGAYEGRLESVIHPNGTMSFYAYALVGVDEQETITRGEPNGTADAIVNGTKTVKLRNSFGFLLSERSYAVQSGVGIEYLTDEIIYENDVDGRVTKKTFYDGTTEEMGYDCCQLEWMTDRNGVTTTYQYDDMKRKIGETRQGVTTLYVYDAANNLLEVKREGSDGSLITLSTKTYDTGGNLVTETNPLGGMTSYSQWADADFHVHRKTILPSGGERTEVHFRDGQLKEVHGNASFPKRYDYLLENETDGFGTYFMLKTRTIKRKHGTIGLTVNDTLETDDVYADFVGRSFRTKLYPFFPIETILERTYNSVGQVIKSVARDGVERYFGYDAQGHQEWGGIDRNGNGQIDEGGIDAITKTLSDVTTYTDGGNVYDVHRSQTLAYPTDQSTATRVLSEELVSTDGLRRWSIVYRDYPGTPVISKTETIRYAGGLRSEIRTRPDGSQTHQHYDGDRLSEVSQIDAQGKELTKLSYSYDAHGRQSQVHDSQSGTASYAYNSADLIVSVTAPSPDGIGPAQVTQTIYDNSLRPVQVIHPDGGTDHTAYSVRGEPILRYGSRVTPVAYTYDAQGRVINQDTWYDFDFINGQGIGFPQRITWSYHDRSGLPQIKQYPIESTDPSWETHQESYSHDGFGRPTSFYTPGSSGTSRSYDEMGNVTHYGSVNDGQIEYTYNRLGQRATTVYNGMTTSYSYNDAGLVVVESYSGAHLGNDNPALNYEVRYDYDAQLRKSQVQVWLGSSLRHQVDYSYDANSGRLATVAANGHQVHYDYLAKSNLVRKLEFDDGQGNEAMTSTRSYDKLKRLTKIETSPGSGRALQGLAYQYDSGNRRAKATAADGSWWDYSYDSNGQLSSGIRHWENGWTVPGQNFTYTYDDVGNREVSGGRVSSQSTYTTNQRNQLASRSSPGKFDLMGMADPEATIYYSQHWEAGPISYRHGAYFHKALDVISSYAPNPDSPPRVGGVTLSSSEGGGTIYINVAQAADPDPQVYNQRGDLIQDTFWDYEWDALGRLTKMIRRSHPFDVPREVEYAYDHMGRRIYRKITWNTVDPPEETHFVYDGWNLLYEANANNGWDAQMYVWGLDLSGSEQGAGGVGGLLMVRDQTTGSPVTHHYTSFDGNGNVIGLIDASDRSASAIYEYGPFGELIRATGSMAEKNPFRFSTKFADKGTGLIYYGMRYYNPTTGRWISRDPIGEQGGLNLYGFVGNDPIGGFDLIGLCKCEIKEDLKIRLTTPNKMWPNAGSQAFPRDLGNSAIWKGSEATVHFTMTAVFENECCEFRQEWKGKFNVDGKIVRESAKFVDDEYSRAADPQHYKTQADGTVVFKGTDTPGSAGSFIKNSVSIWVAFRGQIIDVCNGDLIVSERKLYGFRAYGQKPNIGVWTYGFDD